MDAVLLQLNYICLKHIELETTCTYKDVEDMEVITNNDFPQDNSSTNCNEALADSYESSSLSGSYLYCY